MPEPEQQHHSGFPALEEYEVGSAVGKCGWWSVGPGALFGVIMGSPSLGVLLSGLMDCPIQGLPGASPNLLALVSSHRASSHVSTPRSCGRRLLSAPDWAGPPTASHPVAEAKHLCPFQPLGNITSRLLVLLVAMKSPFWFLTESTLVMVVSPKGQTAGGVYIHPSFLTLTFKIQLCVLALSQRLPIRLPKTPRWCKESFSSRNPWGTHWYSQATTFPSKGG